MANDVETERPTLRLAQYLKEFVGHRTPVIKDIARYDEVISRLRPTKDSVAEPAT